MESTARSNAALFPEGLRITPAEFVRIQKLIHDETGIFLRESKTELICSRLAPRLRALGMSELSEYLNHLRERDPAGKEKAQLVNAITTNKTAFFREARHFEILAQKLLVPMAKESGQGRTRKLRIWSAACSSGEEPYTIAITMREALPDLGHWDARILATDIDTEVLAAAETGVYPLERVREDCGAARTRTHFLAGQGSKRDQVQARPELRKLIAFRRLNFRDAQWPVRAQFDAVFCRNALIYFDLKMQQDVVRRLVAQLRPGGLLFLGHSEAMLGQLPELSILGHTAFLKAGP